MTRYARHVNKRATDQRERARADQVENSAGGFVFSLNKWQALDRWLILGADGGTYYASEKKLVKDNAKTIEACLAEDGPRTVARIVEISDSGRAPKNDPAVFALAMAAGADDAATRKAALEALSKVCRIGTHLFQFVDAVKNFRGWGRGLRRAVVRWYTDREADNLAYQVLKYPSRKLDPKDRASVMTHRDVLRLAGGAIGPRTVETDAVLRYVVGGGLDALGARVVKRENATSSYAALDTEKLPAIVHGWEAMKEANNPLEAAKLVEKYGLTHEMVLNQFKTSPVVWEALLQKMPATALIRNLGNMSKCGLLVPFSDAAKLVVAKLGAVEWLRRSRIHPLNVFTAYDTYERGKSKRGSGEWTPVPQVVDALEGCFYTAFQNVEPTGKNHLLAVDCSGSMWGQGHPKYGHSWGFFDNIRGMDIPPRVGAALMAMVTMRSEKESFIAGFSTGHRLNPVQVTSRSTISQAVQAFAAVPMGGTDCALPMRWALREKLPIDHFVVYTDNETWAGHIHPFQALKQYRQKTGRNAKLTVVGMTATDFTIADPSDAGMLDVVGFDTATPKILADFARN